jgi:prepilin-type N-terminal cleavage/methylation domain-containing protein
MPRALKASNGSAERKGVVIKSIHSARRAEGFTLIEVLVAMAVLLIGIMATVALIDRANATTLTTRNREAATNLTRELVEAARSVPYDELSVPIDEKLQGFQGLADERPLETGWQIERRGQVFTVTATVCTVDDAKDGIADHGTDGSSFCDNPTPTAEPDPVERNPEDYKRVRVQAAWTTRGVSREVHQTVLINNPGSAGGPAVLSLDPDNFVGATVTSGSTLRFKVITSSIPKDVTWLVDGARKGHATKSDGVGYQWTFDWPVGPAAVPGDALDPSTLLDGPYLVGAEAFNKYGVSGPSRSLTIRLNRSLPLLPAGLAAGRSGDPSDLDTQIVNLEWLKNPERDIVRYRVFRATNPSMTGAVEVCSVERALACLDSDPPPITPLYYVVRAYDLGAGGVERANPTDHTPVEVDAIAASPGPPGSFTVEGDPEGNNKLTWSKPPDVGAGIDFYRLYRDGTSVADRYFRIDDDSATVSFTDNRTDGVPHSYWVTAVDNNYAESAFQGPVTR